MIELGAAGYFSRSDLLTQTDFGGSSHFAKAVIVNISVRKNAKRKIIEVVDVHYLLENRFSLQFLFPESTFISSCFHTEGNLGTSQNFSITWIW